MSKSLRIIINTYDILSIEKCSQRTASQKMYDMRVFFNKIGKRYKMTFTEYAIYSGIDIEEIEAYRYF